MKFQPIFPGDPNKFIIIAGPCSAESEEQIMVSARALATYPEVDFFRAGIWKPRTRPGSFEGPGTIGLEWLKRVKIETGLKCCTEIATANHIEHALEAGMDMLWIGARTTVNPFLMDEIASALSGTDIPVFVKNPVNPDLDLWIGAFERLYRRGITRLAAVHRGFSRYGKHIYRNEPLWEIVSDLRKQFPELPLIHDPGHMTGSRSLVPESSIKAIDLCMNGIMTEVHPTPETALSDPLQQLSVKEFDSLLFAIHSRILSGKKISLP